MMPSRDPNDLCPELQEFWPKLKAAYEAKFPNRRIFLTCTYRSVEEQASIFAQNDKTGHILTKCDGIKMKSLHNYKPARAFDFAVQMIGSLEGMRTVWDVPYYKDAADMIVPLGYGGKVRSGGWFVSFKDWPHMEVVYDTKGSA